MARFFTLEEARALLPTLEKEIRQAIQLKAKHQEVDDEFSAISRRIMMLGGAIVDREKLLALRSRRDAVAMRLKEKIEAIHESGCLVKDLDVGLLDFPTLFRGEEVYLCWKLGEPDIRFWHGVHEGFRGRKPIDQEFIENHRGDLPQ
jgi:hypothetical protein